MGALRSPHEATSPSIASRFYEGAPMSPLSSLSVALSALLVAATAPCRAETITFAASKGLDDFEFAATGGGKPGEWSIVRDDSVQALAQTGTDPTNDRFPLAIYRPFLGRNVYVSARFMPVDG